MWLGSPILFYLKTTTAEWLTETAISHKQGFKNSCLATHASFWAFPRQCLAHCCTAVIFPHTMIHDLLKCLRARLTRRPVMTYG
ncbi:hypothetical protein BKA67DRAFT_554587 [Truncatella angustata]|uniref:Uncharacterized protein n=1 Tax=Truncatella angustata TaxID=152316 RepID=A0A9P9A0F4_9PEZI|nr:uncharacterized protein BKA67DRAFT_554587 [Truncatella angustata]KAH6657213.1 hypothetical protein BKA67DRAFT_554587 [Truncatella angustata]